MSTDPKGKPDPSTAVQKPFEQLVLGSRRFSNYFVCLMVTIGGVGFILASFSSYLGKDLLPLGHPSSMIFVPQGLVLGLYGIAAAFLAIYLFLLIVIDFGAGKNLFDKKRGLVTISRRGFFKEISVEIKLSDVKAVKMELREGLNPRRRICLRVNGRKDVPLSGVGSPTPIDQLEREGAELARFIGVNLEGM